MISLLSGCETTQQKVEPTHIIKEWTINSNSTFKLKHTPLPGVPNNLTLVSTEFDNLVNYYDYIYKGDNRNATHQLIQDTTFRLLKNNTPIHVLEKTRTNQISHPDYIYFEALSGPFTNRRFWTNLTSVSR